MPETLEGLEQRRHQLYQQLTALGDFRPGMISVNYRKCGKANCACARADHPGHGPQYLWNTTHQGKSQAQNIRLGPELEKVERELENYRRFLALCRDLVEVNTRICQLRPPGELAEEKELEQLKKKLHKRYNKRRSKR
jgi:hypothetical protein